MKNKIIIEWLDKLAKQYEFIISINQQNKDALVYSYKLKSIENAINIINNIEYKIKSGSELKEYKGIGDGIARRVDEILKTKKLSEIFIKTENLVNNKFIDDLTSIFGIGKKKALEFITKNKITSPKEVLNAYKNKKINLPKHVIKGLKYLNKIKTKIPRSEMNMISKYLIKKTNKIDSKLKIEICGSYRREAIFSNDIDIILSHPDIKTKNQLIKNQLSKHNFINLFVNELIKDKFIVDSFTSTNVLTKYMGICRLTIKHDIRRIDIRFIPTESFYTSLLYFTGSGDFNKRMRIVALSMGYKLNEYGLFDENKIKIKIKSEKDIFDKLNMEYVEPKFRK
jgi:DNA polymerase/3'-5' exonuclease PolX